MNSVRNNDWGLQDVVDFNGNQVSNLTQAVGVTYTLCLKACGSAPEPFNWQIFSSQITSWVLPWLALTSQIPYGPKDKLSQFLTLVLTVGSPTLAAYSLALAVISNRWMVERFKRSNPRRHASAVAHVLSDLQQVSLRYPESNGCISVLPSLGVLEQNKRWWMDFSQELRAHTQTKWTFAAIMSIFYVLLASLLTWINTLGSIPTPPQINASGVSIGALWLSLLPIVACYLQLSPKIDSDQIQRAFVKVNRKIYLAAATGSPSEMNGSHVISVERTEANDKTCSSPVFYYARFFSWISMARLMTDGFEAASSHVGDKMPESFSEVNQCCENYDRHGYSYDVFSIVFRSALLALFLQGGATGAAVMATYLTFTTGYTLRRTFYLFYGCLSGIVWLLSLISSLLARDDSAFEISGDAENTSISNHDNHDENSDDTRRSNISNRYHPATRRHRSIRYVLSCALSHLAKVIAFINMVFLFAYSLLQFGSVFDSCFWNSVVLSRGAKYVLLDCIDKYPGAKFFWAGGVAISSATALSFSVALYLLTKRPVDLSEYIELDPIHDSHLDS
ncbi:hypothetical protein APHAL10511_002874 [Amanita phalloides]|nr:hypothetical protein APHAL10511_002874 [Amanita phalloides]